MGEPQPAPRFSVENLQRRIDTRTKPVEALGRLEDIAFQIGYLQQSCVPRMDSCGLLIFVADHGIATEGVSAYPQSVTRAMLLNFLSGGAAGTVLARSLGADCAIIDAGVAGDAVQHPDLISKRIGPGTQNFLNGPAMTRKQAQQALDIGCTIAEKTAHDALCCGEMGIGNTSSAALLTHKLLGVELLRVVGRGTGLNDDGLTQKLTTLKKAAARTPPALGAEEALIEYGGFEIAMMAGAMIGAAKNKKIVLVDGVIATSAALVALEMEPGIKPALMFAHVSGDAAHAPMLDAMAVKPLFDLGLRLGEGTGALLAWPIVKAAAAMLRDMASFESAGVSGPA